MNEAVETGWNVYRVDEDHPRSAEFLGSAATEEEAREALESRVPDGGEGEDMQEAFFQAKEATEKASGDLAARLAQRKAAEEALGRARGHGA